MIDEMKGGSFKDYEKRKGDWGRDMVLLLARQLTPLKNRELARWLGSGKDSAVAQAVRRIQIRLKTQKKLQSVHQKLKHRLSHVKM